MLWNVSKRSLFTLALLSVVGVWRESSALAQGTTTRHLYSIPQLTYAATNRDRQGDTDATYYFTLKFPASEGAALGSIDLTQTEGLPITLVPQETIAFEGTRHQRGQAIPLEATWIRMESEKGRSSVYPDTLRLTFKSAIAPGQTVTIAVRAARNPMQEDICLYHLVAHPEGNVAESYPVGTARLTFYDERPSIR